jgi:hypothetical protein
MRDAILLVDRGIGAAGFVGAFATGCGVAGGVAAEGETGGATL